MRRFVVGLFVIVGMTLGLAPEAGATVLVSGMNNGLAATASFTITGNTLTILLSNTDTAPRGPSYVPSEVLTGLFFNLGTSGDVFTPVSATIAAGSLAQPERCDIGPCSGATTNVGGEWSYAFGGVNDPDIVGANRGISSAGYLNANFGNFNGSNLDRPLALNGASFGIVDANYVDGEGNRGLDKDPLIRGSATFVLDIPDGLTESMISNVYFTYGTSLNNPSFTTTTTNGTGSGDIGNVPEPSTLALAGAGLAIAAYRLRRRRA
jgi:hypothetical protein